MNELRLSSHSRMIATAIAIYQNFNYKALAVCGMADCIISGDKDLLGLNPFRGIAVLKPDEFLKEY